jgi:hypothetical protein
VGGASGKVLIEHKVAASWQFLKISRTWTTLDAALNFLLPDANYVKLIGGYFTEAKERQKQRMKKLGVSGLAVRTYSEFAEAGMLHGSVMRRKARGFEGWVGTAIGCISTGARWASWLALGGLFVAFWILWGWAAEREGTGLPAPTRWMIAAPLLALAYTSLRRLAARLGEADVRLP